MMFLDSGYMSPRCVAFTGHRAECHRCIVKDSGTVNASVKVWDPIAGHYTQCHTMPAWAQLKVLTVSRILNNAKGARR